MRMTLTAVDATTAERVDVLVELDPSDPVSALERTLVRLLPSAGAGLWLGGRRLDGARTVSEERVVPGCLLHTGAPGPHLTPPTTRAALHVVSGPGAGGVHGLPDGDIVVGSAGGIRLDDPELARRHLELHTGPAGVVVTDLTHRSDDRAGAPGSLGVTAAGGRALAGPTAVGAADLIAVGRSLLAVLPTAASDAAVTDGPDLTRAVNRPPRLRPARTVSTLELPTPATAPESRKLAVLPLVLPLLLGVAMAFLLNPLFLLFTLLSPLLALSSWWSDRRQGRTSGAKVAAAFAETTERVQRESARLALVETLARRAAYPDAAELGLVAAGPGRRVWERRRADDDSLVLRVGSGPAEAETVRLTGPATLPRPEQPQLVDVPVTVPLREVGVLGVAGPREQACALARWLVGQAAVLHSPRDLSVQLLVDPATPAGEVASDWAWLRWLPHAAPAFGQDCPVVVGATVDALTARIAELTALVAARTAAAQDVRAQLTARRQPDVLVVLDGARSLRSLAGMAVVLRDGPAVGVYLLCVDEQEELLPEECQAVATCQGSARLTLRRSGEPTQAQVRADLVGSAWAEAVARGLAPLRDAGSDQGEGQVPQTARLLEVLGLPEPTAADIRGRMGRTTSAVVGVGADGPFALDLRRDGPHTLIAGTTGSGKSELLQTLVASLAVANRPDAMNFVLVDYKGGAAFKDCARLPHTVGMVTDLDGHLVERALASLTAELKTREGLLADAGAKDLEDYWDTGATLPRLVIVIDEFASLVEELPDFVRGLVGIAQRGRSLGVHLVLATQRPSGVVSPEIRANTNLRIALRVTDATESLDVLDSPEAATIAKATPGRAYARTGHTALTAFQSARVGGRTPGAALAHRPPIEAVLLPWAQVGDAIPPVSRVESEPDADQTDLRALVLAVQQACLDLPPGRTPWLDPLPTSLTLAEVRRATPPPASGLPLVVFGLEDLPAAQTRAVAALDLERGGHLVVAGAARSGRSTLLRTLGTSLAATVAPADAHLYAIDCGTGALLPLADLPHCGAVVTRTQVDRADRLLTRLSAEVARRQELLAERGFADVAEQRLSSADPLPYLVLLVDRWEGFTGAFEEVDNGRLTDTFLRLLREGLGAGLRVVVTGDRSVLLGKVASAVEDVLVLRLADRSDYALAGLSPRVLPEVVTDGRAFRGNVGTQVQVALLVDDPSGAAQAAAVAELAEHWRGRRVGGRLPFRVEVLPSRITAADAAALAPPPVTNGQVAAARAEGDPASGASVSWQISVGVGGDELALQTVDLSVDGPGFTVAGPQRSGRSTALLGATRSLLTAGTEVVILAPRPSPLRDLVGSPGVLLVATTAEPDVADVVAALNAATGPLVVVVDDAELLLGAEVADLLQQILREGRDHGHVVLVGGTTSELAATFRGFTADARKSRSGLLLSPASHLDGDLLGVRLARSAAFTGPAGRGLLVRGGAAQLVQVPLA